jgi:hypothetical protein
LFTHPRAGKQLAARGEFAFGEQCMLGKLCRLAKRCGLKRDETQFSVTSFATQRAAIRQPVEV